MKILFKLPVIISVLFIELMALQYGTILLFGLGHGKILDTRYRNKERVAAFIENIEQPSAQTKANLQKELDLMHKHEDWKTYLA